MGGLGITFTQWLCLLWLRERQREKENMKVASRCRLSHTKVKCDWDSRSFSRLSLTDDYGQNRLIIIALLSTQTPSTMLRCCLAGEPHWHSNNILSSGSHLLVLRWPPLLQQVCPPPARPLAEKEVVQQIVTCQLNILTGCDIDSLP